jgi:probable F420-dependent oxidoreductase
MTTSAGQRAASAGAPHRARRRLRFGVVNELVPDTTRWLDHVRRVEDAGVDVLVVRDHLSVDAFGSALAPLPALAAAAARTTRIRLGTLVLSNDFRHPAFVAQDAATIDYLSAGRLELGLGAGWQYADYRAAGILFDPAGKRIARLEEAISIIDRLLSGETVTFEGTHYTLDSLALPTIGVQRPRPPLLVGGGGPKMLSLAARRADIVGLLPAPITSGDHETNEPTDRSPAAVEAKLAVLRSAAPERFDTLELSMFATFVVTDRRRRDTESLIDRMGWGNVTVEKVWTMPSVLIGSPAQICEDLRLRLHRFGLSYYVTTDHALDDLSKVIDTWNTTNPRGVHAT